MIALYQHNDFHFRNNLFHNKLYLNNTSLCKCLILTILEHGSISPFSSQFVCFKLHVVLLTRLTGKWHAANVDCCRHMHMCPTTEVTEQIW